MTEIPSIDPSADDVEVVIEFSDGQRLALALGCERTDEEDERLAKAITGCERVTMTIARDGEPPKVSTGRIFPTAHLDGLP